MARDPYAPPPMLPRQWLPLNPGTIVGTPSNFPAPNPMGVNWPKAQFANPSFVGSTVRLMPQKPVRPSERVGAGPMHWSWSQFGNGKQNLPRFAPNPEQKPPVVLYSGPDTDSGTFNEDGKKSTVTVLRVLWVAAAAACLIAAARKKR